MRISILGAGAVGGYLAARLAARGADVQVIARGETLEAIRRNGIRIEGNADVHARPAAAMTIAEATPADVVVSCVKAYAVPALAADIARLVAPGGLWIGAVNGLPWWYGALPLDAVDPGGRIRAGFPMANAAVAVAYLAAEVLRPGVIAFIGGKGLILATPDNRSDAVLASMAQALTDSGIDTTVTADAASAIWNKLFGNVGLNPLTALTGLPVDRLLADHELRAMLTEVTAEAMTVAAAEGAKVEMSAEDRVAFMQRLGAFRTSMLQDADARRAIELDAILGAVLECGARRGIAMPASRRTYALARAFASSRGLLPD